MGDPTETIVVAQYELTVDARETVRAVLDSGDLKEGARLTEALELATSYDCYQDSAYVLPAGTRLDRVLFRPQETELVDVAARTANAVLDKLRDAGYLTTYCVWRDTSSETYASEGRFIAAVRVVRPFTLVSVRYTWSHPGLMGYADDWTITDKTRVVRPGWYLVAEIGDFSTEFVGATGIDASSREVDGPRCPDSVAESLVYWVSEIEGFMASRCCAKCVRCGAHWSAECGSWHFFPEYGHDAEPWDFDDATDFDDDYTIPCPHCGTGRVGFFIS